MKNRVLGFVRKTIPFSPELAAALKSREVSMLMIQLEYWFEIYPGGFYKFTEPCKSSLYNPGDSWIEELGFSAYEMRDHFAKIGETYLSRTIYEAEKDKFKGKFYCRYRDRKTEVTWYFRNHYLVDKFLTDLLTPKVNVYSKRPYPEGYDPENVDNTASTHRENLMSRDQKLSGLDLQEFDLPYITNNTNIGDLVSDSDSKESSSSTKSAHKNEKAVFGDDVDEEEKVEKKNRATRIKENWQIDESLRKWINKKYPFLDENTLEDIRFKFVNYWSSEPDKRARKINWNKTFQNHLMDNIWRYQKQNKQEETNGNRANGHQQQTKGQRMHEYLRQLEEKDRNSDH